MAIQENHNSVKAVRIDLLKTGIRAFEQGKNDAEVLTSISQRSLGNMPNRATETARAWRLVKVARETGILADLKALTADE